MHDLEIQTYPDRISTIKFANSSTTTTTTIQPALVHVFTFNLDEIIFVSEQPFEVEMSPTTAASLGFENNYIVAKKDQYYYIQSDIGIFELSEFYRAEKDGESSLYRYSELKFTFFEEREDYISFPNNQTFQNAEDMTRYIAEHCQRIFYEFFLDRIMEKIQFRLQQRVISINFTNMLNFILGFKENLFLDIVADAAAKNIYRAEYKPQINRGLINMYVYANICSPTYVGHMQVPLLKNIFIDQTAMSDMRNYIVRRPMYIPVSSTTFSRIEIDIRNKSGQRVSFPAGAITYLTLHFRKHKRRQ